jgi:flagellar motor switch protein FliN/FliY
VATLDKVSLDIAVVLGTTTMPVHQALRLGRGAIIELDASEEDEVRILVNNFPVATGAVVVSGNRIAVELKEMLPRAVGDRGFRPPRAALVPTGAICYMRGANCRLSAGIPLQHAVVAELVDALA